MLENKTLFIFLLAFCLPPLESALTCVHICYETSRSIAVLSLVFNGLQHQPMSGKKQTTPSCSLHTLFYL